MPSTNFRAHRKNQITSEERKLIDEAVEAGRVTVVDAGLRGLSDQLVFCQVTKRLTTPEMAEANKARGKPKIKAKRTVAMESRRKQVAALMQKGLKPREIAAIVGDTTGKVYHDIRKIKECSDS